MLEVITGTADALAHNTYGVNEKIKALVVRAGDERPPLIVKVLNVVDHPQVVHGEFGDDWPILMVDTAAPIEWEGEVMTMTGVRRSVQVPIQIVYLTGKADKEIAVRDTWYTLRAMQQTMFEYLDNDKAETDRLINDVALVSVARMIADEVDLEITGARVRGVMTLEWEVRDIQPGGI